MNVFEKILADARQERERRQAERERIFTVRQRLHYINQETAYQPNLGENHDQKTIARRNSAAAFVVYVARRNSTD